MNIDVENLERATLDAVAPPEILEIDDWLLPMDRSTIGRAISAVPKRHSDLNPASVRAIESVYQSRGLKTQFRIPDVPECANIHAELRRCGFTPVQPTLTQIAPLTSGPVPVQGASVTVSNKPTESWRAVYLSEGFDPVDGLNRVNALSRSAYVRYAHVEQAGRSIAAGTASTSHGWIGIHGMRTLPEARGQGLATMIIRAFVQEALQSGQSGLYLQVEEKNTGAVRLYEKLGFRTAWRYHYWKKVTQP